MPTSISRRCRTADALEKLIGSPDLCSKRWVWEQYDHVILGNTVQRPGGDAAVVRIKDGPKALALTADVTPRYCEADPFEGGKQAVAEAWRNLTAVGARPLARHRQSQFRQSRAAGDHGPVRRLHPRHRRGLPRARLSRSCPAMSRSTTRPTAARFCRRRPSAASGCSMNSRKSMTLAFKAEGEAILLIGETRGWLGQSLYLREVCGREEGAPPPVDLAAERRHGDFVRGLIGDGPRDGGARCFRRRACWSRSPRWRWRPASAPCSERRTDSRACLLVRRGPGALCGHGRGRGARPCGARACGRRAADAGSASTGGTALTLPGERPLPVADLARALRGLAAGLHDRTRRDAMAH